uniref:NADH dehydrogenase subunit 2 n=1 Tax=Chaetosphaeridium globosum TaxID=96477 RepID=Q8M1E7_CHAGL|nr:NADH dehydrogenase subunit 2 [Chaetosphaeridium globosum]AAM96605.1 NADH dehydrogenase subunit 2 [Chaetosphaeridium globosum]
MFDQDFVAILPEIFLINASIILLMYGVFCRSRFIIRNIAWLGLLSIIVTLLLHVNNVCTTANLFYNNLILDNFTFYCKMFLLLSTASVILMCLDYFKQENVYAFESIILILFSTCSMLLMISAYDLITMYLAIELQSLCFYVIAASQRNSEFSTEAGLKYFLLGAFSSGILLFGCSLLYGFTGVTNYEELAKIMLSFSSSNTPGMLAVAILFIAVGFLFKITAVPFHMWAPDVYEGSPTYVTAFFSIAPKIAILANMLRIFVFSLYDPTWQQLFFFSSAASMIVGALAAMSQNKIKRLLAYSSIGHIGYICIGFCCGTLEGIASLLIALFIYICMTINVFAAILSLRKNTFKYIGDLGGLSRTNPVLAITLAITMFSYAGIPPLAGFCSKFYLFFAALGSGLGLLAFIGVVTSVISCFYYIRFVKIMYFDTAWILFEPMDREKSLILGITLLLILFFFLYPSPLFLITHQMALRLCF